MGLKPAGLRGSLRNISQVSVIPGSVTNHWRADEGSGSTLADSIGSADFSLNFSTWANDTKYAYGTAPNLDGNDDYGDSTGVDANQQDLTFTVWASDYIASDFAGIATSADDINSEPSEGWVLYFEGTNTDAITFRHYTSSSSGTTVDAEPIPDVSANQVMFGVVQSGDSTTLYVYDTNGLQYTYSGTQARGITTKPLKIGAQNGNYADIVLDDMTFTQGSALTESVVTDIWDSTGPNA